MVSYREVMLLGGLVSIAFGVAALKVYSGLSLTFAVVWTAWWLLLTGAIIVYALQERSRSLSRRFLEQLEHERATLARELHDQLGQSLVGISLNLESIKGELSPASRARVPESVRVIKEMIAQVQTLAFELRPSTLDEYGLVEALRNLVARYGERAGVPASFSATPTGLRAPAEIETACFRIVQEALTNVARHARARHVEVTLTAQDGALEVRVKDDGVGFDVERRRSSLGLVGMVERAEFAGGHLDIESAPGAGTTLRARFPLSRGAMN